MLSRTANLRRLDGRYGSLDAEMFTFTTRRRRSRSGLGLQRRSRKPSSFRLHPEADLSFCTRGLLTVIRGWLLLMVRTRRQGRPGPLIASYQAKIHQVSPTMTGTTDLEMPLTLLILTFPLGWYQHATKEHCRCNLRLAITTTSLLVWDTGNIRLHAKPTAAALSLTIVCALSTLSIAADPSTMDLTPHTPPLELTLRRPANLPLTTANDIIAQMTILTIRKALLRDIGQSHQPKTLAGIRLQVR